MTLRRLVRPVLSAVALAAPLALQAQTQTPPANEQVVDPKVDRREVKLPKFPSKDFEVGVFLGTYATQNFGASAVAGLKLGYHITEDFFVEAAFGATKVSDESFRQILPGGVFVNETEKLSYYNLSVGYNILPGEVFIGRRLVRFRFRQGDLAVFAVEPCAGGRIERQRRRDGVCERNLACNSQAAVRERQSQSNLLAFRF